MPNAQLQPGQWPRLSPVGRATLRRGAAQSPTASPRPPWCLTLISSLVLYRSFDGLLALHANDILRGFVLLRTEPAPCC